MKIVTKVYIFLGKFEIVAMTCSLLCRCLWPFPTIYKVYFRHFIRVTDFMDTLLKLLVFMLTNWAIIGQYLGVGFHTQETGPVRPRDLVEHLFTPSCCISVLFFRSLKWQNNDGVTHKAIFKSR